MSDKTLSKARGLNSIADPRSFKGSSGRAKLTETRQEPSPEEETDEATDESPAREYDPSVSGASTTRSSARRTSATDADVDLRERPGAEAAPRPDARQRTSGEPANGTTATPTRPRTTPHRAVTPGIRRKRRELSVPHPVAEALENTGINPADVVMSGYRHHSDAIYAGAGGRMVAKGRTRLRLSISDSEFEQLTRLGEARGWNRSETVSVILAMELLTPADGGDTTP